MKNKRNENTQKEKKKGKTKKINYRRDINQFIIKCSLVVKLIQYTYIY